MYYKLFLDTNIYEGQGFSFEGYQFSRLRDFVKNGILNLQINAVVDGEVRAHIKKHIPEALQELRKSIKPPVFAAFRNRDEFPCLSVPEDKIWVDDAISRFDCLLKDLNAEIIPVNGLDVDSLLDDYFNMRLPFEEKKPYEFKDAILLQSVFAEIQRLSQKNGSTDTYIFKPEFEIPDSKSATRSKKTDGKDIYYRTDDLICLFVSDDKGVRSVAEKFAGNRPNEDVKVFSSLRECVDFLTRQEKVAAVIGAMLDNGFAFEDIVSAVSEVLDTIDVEIEDYGGILEEVIIENTDNLDINNINTYILVAQEFSDESKAVRFIADVDLNITLRCSYINENMSPWDHETKEYLWRTIDTDRCEYKTRIELVLSMYLPDIKFEWDIDLNDDDVKVMLAEVCDGEWSADVEIEDCPDSISLYSSDCLERENIESYERVED